MSERAISDFRVERVDGRARVTTDEERVLRGGCRDIGTFMTVVLLRYCCQRRCFVGWATGLHRWQKMNMSIFRRSRIVVE